MGELRKYRKRSNGERGRDGNRRIFATMIVAIILQETWIRLSAVWCMVVYLPFVVWRMP